MPASLGARSAIGLHRLDQRIELGELARDLHVAFGIDLAQQLGFERGVVGEQDVEFGFGQHGTVLEWRKRASGVGGDSARYNDSPSASANSVSFCRIETLPEGASSSGSIIASAFLASRSRIIAFTGPCAVADSDSER